MTAVRARIVSNGFSADMQPTITLALEKPLEVNLEGLLDVEITQHREHRSLRQNAYYRELLDRVAGALKIGRNELHNMMLRDYGQPLLIDGRELLVLFPDDDQTARELLHSEDIHVQRTNDPVEYKDGKPLAWYRWLRGSRTYDTAEMARLIDGLVEVAHDIGVETLTRDELERMKAYGQGQQGKGEARRT